jgi:hypothetical protein
MLEKTAFYGLPSLPSGPYRGSAIVMWDSGPGVTPPAPLAPIPPSVGTDPHEHPRATPAAREQKSTFLRTGEVVDVCAGKPCHTSAFLP